MTPQRNNPCPCGSGRKYKRCCMRKTGVSFQAPAEIPRSYSGWLLRISLDHIKPEIYRSVVVPLTMKLFDLHRLIQSFGWFDCHLWRFSDAATNRTLGELVNTPSGPRRRSSPFDRAPGPDAKKVTVEECFDRFDDEILYEYDFGDGWIHRIRLEDEVEFPEPFQPTVLTGAHAFPPEDCGGPPGYARLQACWRDGKDPHGDEDYEDWAKSIRVPRLKKADVPSGYPVLSNANQTVLHEHAATVAAPTPSTPTETFTPLSPPVLQELQRRLEETAQSFEREHRCQTSISIGKSNDLNGSLKVEIATVTDSGTALTPAAVSYLKHAPSLDLEPSWLGKPFTCGKDEARITGLNPRAKESVLLESLPEPGKPSQTFKMHPDRVPAFFKKPTKEPSPDPQA